MALNSNDPNNKDRVIAAALTFLCVLAILLILFCCGLRWERQELAITSTPEIMEQQPEFYEPELLPAGEDVSNLTGEPAPATSDMEDPAPAVTEQVTQPVPSESEANSSARESALATQKKDNHVKNDTALTAYVKAADALAGKFKPVDGRGSNPNAGAAGTGGAGDGVTGSAKGRTFLSCPKPNVTLRHKTIVNVAVTIDADGTVTKASASGTADQTLRKKCEEAAKKARWEAKPGASPVQGTITFTLIPK